MSLALTILYRGTLSSCNYDCPYCPFAKHWESSEELATDRAGLDRFSGWVAATRDRPLSIFFTPWGEALVRRWYRDAIVHMTHHDHVQKVAVQTNLSCNLEWTSAADASKLALWCTYHPGQVSLDSFLAQCKRLSVLGVRHSVGCVGMREHFTDLEELRQQLPPATYLWVNALKSKQDYYRQSDVEFLSNVDPFFEINNQRHPSKGHRCRTGESVITVDSKGDVRRCYFVDEVIGNLYETDLRSFLMQRTCPNETCGCHIGYVHLEPLELNEVYGDGLLERVPRDLTWSSPGQRLSS